MQMGKYSCEKAIGFDRMVHALQNPEKKMMRRQLSRNILCEQK